VSRREACIGESINVHIFSDNQDGTYVPTSLYSKYGLKDHLVSMTIPSLGMHALHIMSSRHDDMWKVENFLEARALVPVLRIKYLPS
jgi:hypothetical protein